MLVHEVSLYKYTQWRRSLMPGRGLLVGRIEELNTEGLVEAQPLPDHVTHPVIQ